MLLRRIMPLFIALAIPLSAAAKTPLETLKASQSKLDTLLASSPASGSPAATERRSKLEAEAKVLFDFEELAKRALGKHWETGTPAQQTEFVTLFSDIIRKNYLDQLEGRSSKAFTLSWGKEEVSGSEATVTSSVKGKTAEGKPVDIAVQYKLLQKGADWRVYDVVTDGESLLAQQKESFSKSFKKNKDFEGVLKQLRSKAGTKSAAKAP